ncbi:MAG: ferrous iron transport protein A [Clostridia bacterium]|nr:ferrous iron transport protein A [Clostridia bacterium]
MKKGQSGVIQEINIDNPKRKIRLLEMGLTLGTKIKIKKIAPTGEPISIELRGYELCISKKDASKIRVYLGMR